MGGRGASSSGAKAGGATKAAAKAGGAIVSAATGAKSKILAGAGDASAAVASQLGAQAKAGQKTMAQIIAEAGSSLGASPVLKAATRGPIPTGAAFGKLANAAAQSVPESGRYGERNVYISEAFKAAQSKVPGLTRDSFVSALDEARRNGLVELSRATLKSAMDADKLDASEFSNGIGTFHFIIDKRVK